MGKLVEAAQTAYDTFWNDLKTRDLTKIDMATVVQNKTKLEIAIDKAKEKEETFYTARNVALETADADITKQIEAKEVELNILKSTLSASRTAIEQKWQAKEDDGTYDVVA